MFGGLYVLNYSPICQTEHVKMFCIATLTEASSFGLLYAVTAQISTGTNMNVLFATLSQVLLAVNVNTSHNVILTCLAKLAFVWIAYLVNVLHGECPHCTQKLVLLKVVVFACMSMLQRQLTYMSRISCCVLTLLLRVGCRCNTCQQHARLASKLYRSPVVCKCPWQEATRIICFGPIVC